MIRAYQDRDYKALQRMLEERGFPVIRNEFEDDIIYVIESHSKVIGFISLAMTLDLPLLKHFCASKKCSRSMGVKVMWQLLQLVRDCMDALSYSFMYIAIPVADKFTNKLAKKYYNPILLGNQLSPDGCNHNLYLAEVI